MNHVLAFVLSLLFCLALGAQPCSIPGQTPSTAFPVCGTTTFQQTTVPLCGSRTLVVPGCSTGGNAGYMDKNPFWYKFTCFQAGTLAFLIRPNNPSSDYDWQLYDITGRNPDDVFTDPSLVVTANWAGTLGNTGASATGSNTIECGSDPAANRNPFAAMPSLIAGHTYLLMVSHFTDSQSGYALSFGGGTAVITDPTAPALLKAEAGCNGALIRVKLKKRIRCTSLATNGSDFTINAPGTTVTGAAGIGCTGGFDTDSIEVQLAAPLNAGTYQLSVKVGTDGNTLLDHCGTPLPLTDTVRFEVLPQQPTPMDSLAPLSCAPQTLKLAFRKPILCSSVAPNGSDFTLTGPYPISVIGASANCPAGSSVSREITITLSQPLNLGGTFALNLQRGADGNTLLDECTKETPVGSQLTFTLKDTVSADFTWQKRYGCTRDTIFLQHAGNNGVTSWLWNLDEGQTSQLQNPTGLYGTFTTKSIRLVVSNGFCADTSVTTIELDNFIRASFTAFDDNCPSEDVRFTSTAQGRIVSHSWSFGDGGTSALPSPTHVYTSPTVTRPFTVSYTVTDSLGCQSVAQKTIKVYNSCLLAIPNAFTPNNDSKNDYLRVLNAIKADKVDFKVFNRWGQLVFHTKDWKQGWDGRIKGELQGTGTYTWLLVYTDRDTGQVIARKGTATLIR